MFHERELREDDFPFGGTSLSLYRPFEGEVRAASSRRVYRDPGDIELYPSGPYGKESSLRRGGEQTRVSNLQRTTCIASGFQFITE